MPVRPRRRDAPAGVPARMVSSAGIPRSLRSATQAGCGRRHAAVMRTWAAGPVLTDLRRALLNLSFLSRGRRADARGAGGGQSARWLAGPAVVGGAGRSDGAA